MPMHHFPCDLSRAARKMRPLVLLAALLLALPAEGIFEAIANPRPGPNRYDPAKNRRVGPRILNYLVGHHKERVTLCPNFPLPAVSAPNVLAKLQPFLETVAKNVSAALEKDKSPGGVALGVVYNDTLIWSKGFGLINDSDPSRGAPDENTGFRIGSITKVFTSLMMLMLKDGGLLHSLDDDITNYLPEFKIKNPFQTHRGITFRQLSSHMAGLPRNAPCQGIFVTGCNLTYEKIYENLAEMELMYPPGEQPAYSNLGFGLLGRVLEKIRGPTWEEQLKKMILDPLGMTNSGNAFTPESIKKLAVGYYPDGSVADLINIGWDAPAGQMYASIHDLAQLMRLIFRPEVAYNPEHGQILDGETIREWMQPAYKYFDRTGFGHPWELVPLGDFTLRTKDGVLNGYNSEFQMAPEIKTGFIFLQSCDGCGSHREIISIAEQIILEAKSVLLSMQPGPPVPPNPSEYVAVYEAQVTPTFLDIVNITLVNIFGHQALLTTEGGDTAILEWTKGDSFQISVQGIPVPCFVLSSGHIGERVYFQRNGSGRIVSLTVPGLSYGTVYQRQS